MTTCLLVAGQLGGLALVFDARVGHQVHKVVERDHHLRRVVAEEADNELTLRSSRGEARGVEGWM